MTEDQKIDIVISSVNITMEQEMWHIAIKGVSIHTIRMIYRV